MQGGETGVEGGSRGCEPKQGGEAGKLGMQEEAPRVDTPRNTARRHTRVNTSSEHRGRDVFPHPYFRAVLARRVATQLPSESTHIAYLPFLHELLKPRHVPRSAIQHPKYPKPVVSRTCRSKAAVLARPSSTTRAAYSSSSFHSAAASA